MALLTPRQSRGVDLRRRNSVAAAAQSFCVVALGEAAGLGFAAAAGWGARCSGGRGAFKGGVRGSRRLGSGRKAGGEHGRGSRA